MTGTRFSLTAPLPRWKFARSNGEVHSSIQSRPDSTPNGLYFRLAGTGSRKNRHFFAFFPALLFSVTYILFFYPLIFQHFPLNASLDAGVAVLA